jgi:hypothetical protein
MKKKKLPKLNKRKALRESMVEQGAYDGRFREKVVTLKKHKKVKHKHKIYED